jgi:hypothetical protein
MSQFGFLIIGALEIAGWALAVFLSAAVLSFIVIGPYLRQARNEEKAKGAISQWLEGSGHKIVSLELKSGPGPFGEFLVRRGTRYYQFIITDSEGKTREGWARFGPYDVKRFKTKWVENAEN